MTDFNGRYREGIHRHEGWFFFARIIQSGCVERADYFEKIILRDIRSSAIPNIF
jgi:hypothetical protein